MVMYSANMTAGALKPMESQVIAALLLQGLTGAEVCKRLVEENPLQTRSKGAAIRIGRLVLQRLEPMGPELWRLVAEGAGPVRMHALLAATVKNSHLLGDFLDLIVREQWKLMAEVLPRHTWPSYLDDCCGRDPNVATWSESTRKKLGSAVFQCLEQAGYIESQRTMKLQRVFVAPPVLDFLDRHHETYVRRCLEVAQ